MAKARQPKGEKELLAEVQEGLRYLVTNCLRAASIAAELELRGAETLGSDGGIRSLGRELGSISKRLQAVREWESTVVDAWKALDRGARR